MSFYEMTPHAYDIEVYHTKLKQFITVNLWAGDDARARRRVMQELGGEGNLQIVNIRRMKTQCSSKHCQVPLSL